MSDRIRLLPEIVTNQIKAGEVVEYPSSVVKEMMENAIDAGATKVTVNFKNGGRDLIQIVDNGCGMSPNDARMAFECHATSKISSLDDVYALRTFGFRGEALASIAAVSQVELLTRQADAEFGTQTIVNGGEFVSQTPVSTPVGSQFLVRNIFYNTPVRRKFVDKNESRLTTGIKSEFRRVVLCHPEVEFELLNNGNLECSLPASNLAERIVATFKNSTKNNLLEVGVETTIANISGFVGKPSAAKLRSEQYMFVNGRYFHSPYLNKAVVKAYEKLIPDKVMPSFFIYIEVDPERIDVNVHAKKTEVKFADAEAVWQILNAAVRETLAKTGAVPMLDFDDSGTIDIPVATRGIIYDEPPATTVSGYNPFLNDIEESGTPSRIAVTSAGRAGGVISSGAGHGIGINPDFDVRSADEDFDILPSTASDDADDEFEYIESEVDAVEQDLGIEASLPRCGAVTAFGRRYASLLMGGRLTVVDLARARERVLYDTYMAMLRSERAVSQQLLFPERLTLSDEEYSTIEEYSVDFAALGFDISFEGGCTIEVCGIPADATADRIDTMIYDMVQTLLLPQSAEDVRRDRLATTLAGSTAAAKGAYSQQEAEIIVAQLLASSNPNYSPSGKQTIAEITPEDIKNKLG